jgi:hypothetical protein
MRVNIGPYINRWTSGVYTNYMNKHYGYQWPAYGQKGLNNKVEPFREAFLERLEDTLQWIYNHTINLYLDRKHRRVKIRIDNYDTWSMDHTLALIVLPMLKQLKETKHGAPSIDDKDVPKELKSTSAPPQENEWDTDDNHFKRWDYVLDEMIWAFEQKCHDDWESDYYKFEEGAGDGFPFGYKLVWEDEKGRKAHQKRISNGLKLFGKYYEGLWD